MPDQPTISIEQFARELVEHFEDIAQAWSDLSKIESLSVEARRSRKNRAAACLLAADDIRILAAAHGIKIEEGE